MTSYVKLTLSKRVMATGAPLEKKYVKAKITNLNAAILVSEDEADRQEEIQKHIKTIENDPIFQIDPEFPQGLEWFNSGALSFERELRGKIVVLDFFTYCCINCMHVLPDLAKLEQKYSDKDGVVVVGVHSAKFQNEKLSDNIRNAVTRYGITHSVVNDQDIVLWERLGIVCWPTLVIIGPDRQLLYYIIGEGHGAELMAFMDVAVQYYQSSGRLSTDPVGTSLAMRTPEGSPLRYPGKVCLDIRGEKLFVADTGNNRILAVSMTTGTIEQVYGSGEIGLRDGEAAESQFASPQGMASAEGVLYVADTGNHVIRKIDLRTHAVSTLTGTGCHGNDKEGGEKGTAQEICSPWDVELGPSPGSDHSNVLYIAMAGTHQIWCHYLEDGRGLKGSEFVAGTTVRFSGSGQEANRNNSYPHKAAFAQPSGITVTSERQLYVADSESSCVRMVSLTDGSAKAVVGGAIDPEDLFAFGDVDGRGRTARLQHPLGVAWSRKDGMIYVADSYNHKIKVVNPALKECTTLAGSGTAGLGDGPFEHAQFSEPGGLCLDPEGKTLFVADTNNHAIRVLNLETKEVSQLKLSPASASAGQSSASQSSVVAMDVPKPFKRLTGKRAQSVSCEPIHVPRKGEVVLTLNLTPPPGCHLTEGATSAWQLVPGEPGAPYAIPSGQPTRGDVVESSTVTLVLATCFEGQSTQSSLQVEVLMYFCEDSGVCHMKGAVLDIPMLCSDTALKTGETTTTVSYSPELPKMTFEGSVPLKFGV